MCTSSAIASVAEAYPRSMIEARGPDALKFCDPSAKEAHVLNIVEAQSLRSIRAQTLSLARASPSEKA
jgi:hypothetical protein